MKFPFFGRKTSERTIKQKRSGSDPEVLENEKKKKPKKEKVIKTNQKRSLFSTISLPPPATDSSSNYDSSHRNSLPPTSSPVALESTIPQRRSTLPPERTLSPSYFPDTHLQNGSGVTSKVLGGESHRASSPAQDIQSIHNRRSLPLTRQKTSSDESINTPQRRTIHCLPSPGTSLSQYGALPSDPNQPLQEGEPQHLDSVRVPNVNDHIQQDQIEEPASMMTGSESNEVSPMDIEENRTTPLSSMIRQHYWGLPPPEKNTPSSPKEEGEQRRRTSASKSELSVREGPYSEIPPILSFLKEQQREMNHARIVTKSSSDGYQNNSANQDVSNHIHRSTT